MIATGGYPHMPEVPGIEHAINSDGFFELEKLPKKSVVIGAGYIAIEMAGILNALGSDVTLCIRHEEVRVCVRVRVRVRVRVCDEVDACV